MPSVSLARRFAAFQACLALHCNYEIDESLLPVTKETFWMNEEHVLSGVLQDNTDEALMLQAGLDARPGTTKRRQYYNKRVCKWFF